MENSTTAAASSVDINDALAAAVYSSSSSLNDVQEKALSLIPIFSGALSACGSGNIIYMVLTSNKWSPYRRILLGLSCSDFVSSIILSFQAFLVPADTSHRVWAVGTDATCSAMGFFQQLSFCNVWYSGMLSFYFLITVRLGVRQRIFAKRYEPWMHILSIGFNLVTATIGAALGFYRELDIGIGCWVSKYPEGCGCKDDDDFGGDEEGEGECCTSPLIAWIYAGFPFIFFYIAVLVNNWLVYRHVRHTIQKSQSYVKDYNTVTNPRPLSSNESSTVQDRRSTVQSIADSLRRWGSKQRLSSDPPEEESGLDSQTKRIRAVATQAFLYVAAFIAVITPICISRLLESMNYNDEAMLFPLLLINAILQPMQGFFNCLIYVRPSYMQVRKDFPNEGRFWAFRRALHGAKVQPTDDMD